MSKGPVVEVERGGAAGVGDEKERMLLLFPYCYGFDEFMTKFPLCMWVFHPLFPRLLGDFFLFELYRCLMNRGDRKKEKGEGPR